MSCRGKNGKGSGAMGHTMSSRTISKGSLNPATQCLTHHNGIKHVSDLIYEEAQRMLKVFLENVIRDSVTYMKPVKYKMVTAMNIIKMLRWRGVGSVRPQ
ncbi:histone H4-like [Chiloscyllium plagiosum]|uniref:histone H4-like n=1 Tax=Chiloscyllium plagiosum TaxID=36176 RepID=UPI001CB80CEE|nr:histone H4-like [Chiloscyllium plagiosum]